MDHTHLDHRLAGRRLTLLVLAQPPRPIQPGKRPLYHPPLRQLDKTLRTLRPAHHHPAEWRPVEHLLVQVLRGVVRVGVDHLQPRQFLPPTPVEQLAAGAGVVDVGSCHQHRQQPPQAVHPDVPLAALDLLAVVEAVLSALRRGLDRLAVGGTGARAGVATGGRADLLAQRLVEALPGAVGAPAAVPGVDGAPGREIVRQQAPLAAGADQVEDAVEDFTKVCGRSPGPLGFGQERLNQGVLIVGEVGVIASGSHNPLYGPNFEFSHRHSGNPSPYDGLLVQGSNCTVSGLRIQNFGDNGIEVDGSNNIIGGTAAGAANWTFAGFQASQAARFAQFFRVCTIPRSSPSLAESEVIVAFTIVQRNTWTIWRKDHSLSHAPMRLRNSSASGDP